jgi:hypothetical protein
MRHDAHAMERRWIVPLAIGGGAVVLVALFVVFGGGAKTPEAIDAGATAQDATTPIDANAPAWMNATYAPTTTPTITATPGPTPTPTAPPPSDVDAAPLPTPANGDAATVTNVPNGPPLIGGTTEQIAAVLQEHVTELEKDIAKKEAAGQHEEAERERKALQRLKGQLDMVLDGGPP